MYINEYTAVVTYIQIYVNRFDNHVIIIYM